MPSIGTPFLIALCVAGLTTACEQGTKETGGASAKAQGPAQPIRVVVQKPQPSDAARELVLPGSLEAWESAELFSRATGYLESLNVDLGDEVSKGDVLARLVLPEVAAGLRRASARVTAAKAELERRRAKVHITEVTAKRMQGLRESHAGAAAQQDVDIAASNHRIALAEVSLGEADVGVSEAELGRLRALSGFASLRAPFSGRIIQRNLDPGALVREGTANGAVAVVVLARTDKLRLSFHVPEEVVRYVKVGEDVKISLDAFPGEDQVLPIARIAGALDARTHSMPAEADVDNADGRFRAGMFGQVHLAVTGIAGALAIPSRAVRGSEGERYVLSVVDGVVEKVEVHVASDDGKRALVVKGLSPDRDVIVAGSPLAREGSNVIASTAEAQ